MFEADGSVGRSVWFGNGTSALYSALRAVECTGKRVAVQPTVCPNVIAAILVSGNRPLFVDIGRDRLGIDPRALSAVIDKVGAVIAVHAYGTPCEIEAIRAVARTAHVPLIEDCAQAEGATVGNIPVGGFGDVAVFSYGTGKILDCGGGGRAVSGDESLRQRLISEAALLPRLNTAGAAQTLSAAYKSVYNTHYPDVPPGAARSFTKLLADMGHKLLSSGEGAALRIAPRLIDLPREVVARRRKAALYAELTRSLADVRSFSVAPGSAPWRYNVWLEPRVRRTAFKKLLANGVFVSTWFPCIGRFMLPQSFDSAGIENAIWQDESVLNLWVDSATDESAIRSGVMALADAIQ